MGPKLCFWSLACLFSQVGLRELPRMKSNCLPAVTHKHKCKMCGCSTQHCIHPTSSSSRPRARFTLTFMAEEWSSSYLRLFCFQKKALCRGSFAPCLAHPRCPHPMGPIPCCPHTRSVLLQVQSGAKRSSCTTPYPALLLLSSAQRHPAQRSPRLISDMTMDVLAPHWG